MGNCAGVDWASEKHDVLIEDPAGNELLGATFAHDEDGVSALCAALRCFEVQVVAIERPDGLLVDRLLESGSGCWRCPLIRSRPPAIGSAPPVGNPIGLTASCCVLAHRRSSLPHPGARFRSDQGAASLDARA